MKRVVVAALLLVACSDVSLGRVQRPPADDGAGGTGGTGAGGGTTSSSANVGGAGGRDVAPTLDDCPDLRAALVSRGGGLYELPPVPVELVNVFADSPEQVNLFVIDGEERLVPHAGDANGCAIPPAGGWYPDGPSLVTICPETELSPAAVATMAARCARYDK